MPLVLRYPAAVPARDQGQVVGTDAQPLAAGHRASEEALGHVALVEQVGEAVDRNRATEDLDEGLAVGLYLAGPHPAGLVVGLLVGPDQALGWLGDEGLELVGAELDGLRGRPVKLTL